MNPMHIVALIAAFLLWASRTTIHFQIGTLPISFTVLSAMVVLLAMAITAILAYVVRLFIQDHALAH